MWNTHIHIHTRERACTHTPVHACAKKHVHIYEGMSVELKTMMKTIKGEVNIGSRLRI